MDNVQEITDLLRLYEALINHPFANLKEAALNKLWDLDEEAGKRLEEEKKKEEDAKKKQAEDPSKKGK